MACIDCFELLGTPTLNKEIIILSVTYTGVHFQGSNYRLAGAILFIYKILLHWLLLCYYVILLYCVAYYFNLIHMY